MPPTKIPQLTEQRTRPAVSLLGPLKFLGAGLIGPVKKWFIEGLVIGKFKKHILKMNATTFEEAWW